MVSAAEPALAVVLCNAPPDKAEDIARAVLDARLAACVNIVPGVISLYWWQDAVSRDPESTLLIKTRADLVPALTERLRAVHPYEVPEVIALPLVAGAGNGAYRAWVVAETEGADKPA
ncbi:Periplasmic divalent cation tolerance protein CutA [Minicystis rosea]|nr:Periplasmic divalent cation tolerance protein CutA [Minicystis rosea]